MTTKGVIKHAGAVLMSNVDFTLFNSNSAGAQAGRQGDFRIPPGTPIDAVVTLTQEVGPFELVLDDGRAASFQVLRGAGATLWPRVLIHITSKFN